MSLYREDLIHLGFLKIGDVIFINNFFSANVIAPVVSPEQRFFSYEHRYSIPAEWRALARASGDESLIVPLPNTPTITMLGKYYIYSMRCQKNLPNLSGFIARTRHIYNIELYIARENNKLDKHLKK